jgi:hypothetical protein
VLMGRQRSMLKCDFAIHPRNGRVLPPLAVSAERNIRSDAAVLRPGSNQEPWREGEAQTAIQIATIVRI